MWPRLAQQQHNTGGSMAVYMVCTHGGWGEEMRRCFLTASVFSGKKQGHHLRIRMSVVQMEV